MSFDSSKVIDVEGFISRHGLDDEISQELRELADRWGGSSQYEGSLDEEIRLGSRLDGLFDDDPVGEMQPVELREVTRLDDLELTPVRSDAFTKQGARYEVLGLLGRGGMGEVWRVRDRDLNRVLAMKIIRWEIANKERAILRFIEEAQTCAQLQHPGVVPVFEIGKLPDRRFYFTMQEIQGLSMHAVIDELHSLSNEQKHWETTASNWNFQRLMRSFARTCETIAYAHQRGVLHRDLKPSNVMLGNDGQVLVVDWGIAKVLGRVEHETTDSHDMTPDLTPVVTRRAASGDMLTRPGAVTGTPNYMPPEQLEDPSSIDTRADVYALGAVLYKLLTGIAPYGQGKAMAIFFRIAKGPPPAPSEIATLPIPEELDAICVKAMARDPEDRFRDAGALAGAVNAWLEGVQRREQALAVVAQALEIDAEASTLRAAADALSDEATRALQTVPPFAPEEHKIPAWEIEARAAEKQREANITSIRAEQQLQAALNIEPELVEAHEALAKHYLEEHRRAEAREQISAKLEAQVRLRTHVDALPTDHDTRVEIERYLEGTGKLTLHTDTPGATVELYRYFTKNRRLHLEHVKSLGEAPIVELPIDPGSYMLELSQPGRHTVKYPVHVERLGDWHGVKPGESRPTPIVLPEQGLLADDEAYVPAGWFSAGGDLKSPGGFAAKKLWLDAFVVQRFPATNKDYLVFLNDLVAQGREEEAVQHAPRERGASVGEMGSMLYARDDEGRFALLDDAARRGRIVSLDWPVTNIDWYGALAYAEWYAARTGKPWRLLTEWEFEKAARGVDGRDFPWGDGFDSSWSCMATSRPMQPIADVVDSFPIDSSPYGVRGVAGNASSWNLNAFSFDPPEGPIADFPHDLDEWRDDVEKSRVGRGGAWFYPKEFCQSNWRLRFTATFRYGFLGVRLMRPL